ncbi:MAG: gliding motility protein GldL [Saprospiraceae bacterium]|nr:gliding motility protein GldL [Saprospiraceae bacterium]
MSSFIKSDKFKYFKNFLIGVGAAIVMVGALFKILSLEGGDIMLTIGLITEAILFLMLGILPPEKDYYWEKLYPGLDNYNARINPLTDGPMKAGSRPLNGEMVENQLGGMLGELQVMSKSMSSLKALQEVDFSKTKDQMAAMNNFSTRLNDAMASLSASVEDTKSYKDQIANLNKNLTSLNSVYGNILGAYKNMGGGAH